MSDHAQPAPRRWRRRTPVLLLVLGIGSLLAVGLALGPATGASSEPTGDRSPDERGEPSAPTDTVTRGDLSETLDATGTVGYGETWNLPIRAEGVVTDVPAKGSVVRPGEVVIRIAGAPVHLADGDVPLYRELRYEPSASRRLEGDDVAQLQRFLLDAGHDDEGRLEADGIFGRSTQRAVTAWQKEQGLERTGRVDRTQLVFSAGPVRLDSVPRIGADFSELPVTAADATVTAELTTRQQSFIPEGATVSIDAGDGSTVEGTIAETESFVNDSGERRVKATIRPATPLPAGVTSVKLELARTTAEDVVIAPVRAILALAGGGYALEVVIETGTELRAVELGAVVEDLVEVSGDVAEGDRVVVPRQIGGES